MPEDDIPNGAAPLTQTDPNRSHEIYGRIGPAGGALEVTDAMNPLYGTRVDIPNGALEQEIDITIAGLNQGDATFQSLPFTSEMRFFGGLEIRGGDGVAVPFQVSLPNSLGAGPEDQLIVVEVLDLDGISPPEILYRGLATIGSPLTFFTPGFGAFVIISPHYPLTVIGGRFLDQGGAPIAGGLIASSCSQPLLAQTDLSGYFELPAGPAGGRVMVLGVDIEPLAPHRDRRFAVREQELPLSVPTSIPSVIVDIVVGQLINPLPLPQPPPSACFCDPCPPRPVLTSPEQAAPPFRLRTSQTLDTYVFGLGVVGGGLMNPLANTLFDLLQAFWSGSLCQATSVSFWTDDPRIASADTTTGRLTAVSEGETTLHASIDTVCYKFCEAPIGIIPMLCYCHLDAIPAKVMVHGEEDYNAYECVDLSGIWVGANQGTGTRWMLLLDFNWDRYAMMAEEDEFLESEGIVDPTRVDYFHGWSWSLDNPCFPDESIWPARTFAVVYECGHEGSAIAFGRQSSRREEYPYFTGNDTIFCTGRLELDLERERIFLILIIEISTPGCIYEVINPIELSRVHPPRTTHLRAMKNDLNVSGVFSWPRGGNPTDSP